MSLGRLRFVLMSHEGDHLPQVASVTEEVNVHACTSVSSTIISGIVFHGCLMIYWVTRLGFGLMRRWITCWGKGWRLEVCG